METIKSTVIAGPFVAGCYEGIIGMVRAFAKGNDGIGDILAGNVCYDRTEYHSVIERKKAMAKKVKIKTTKTKASVAAFLNGVEDDRLRKDCKALLKLFKTTTGLKPAMWGTSIVGFGEYTYYRANGDVGLFMATGFSPRKSGPTLYVMPGYSDYKGILNRLGPHKLGKSCLYIKSLDGINLDALGELITLGLADLKKGHETNY